VRKKLKQIESKENIETTHGTSQLENCCCNNQHGKNRFDEDGEIHFFLEK